MKKSNTFHSDGIFSNLFKYLTFLGETPFSEVSKQCSVYFSTLIFLEDYLSSAEKIVHKFWFWGIVTKQMAYVFGFSNFFPS